MAGILFETQSPITPSAPNRADIACFVGFVGRRDRPIPLVLQRWLEESGWAAGPYRRASAQVGADGSAPTLLDIPIPIESWNLFDQLFAWEHRPLGNGRDRGTTYLGAAVRSFFAQGGQRCYVVRAGDPVSFTAPRTERLALIARLIPGYRPGAIGSVESSAMDRRSWQGIGHLFGLPDVSFLSLPDLPDLAGVDRSPPELEFSPPESPERFVECSEPEPAPPVDRPVQSLFAPRCDEAGYQEWASALHRVATWLAQQRREVQLVAGLPIPVAGSAAEQNLLAALSDRTAIGALGLSLNQFPGLSSAFMQLVYPWVQTSGGLNLPEQLENPEAVLVGLLAQNALTQGTFRTVANAPLTDRMNLFPLLPRAQVWTPQTINGRSYTLMERVSLFGMTPTGLRLLSDVTTSLSPDYRSASVNRLVSTIIRAARRLGEELVFEASGDALWARMRDSLNGLMLGLLQAGALSGKTPAAAFQVRCDRSTMTPNDLAQGRVVAEIQFTASRPIEQITVVLALSDGGQLVQIPTGIQEAA